MFPEKKQTAIVIVLMHFLTEDSEFVDEYLYLLISLLDSIGWSKRNIRKYEDIIEKTCERLREKNPTMCKFFRHTYIKPRGTVNMFIKDSNAIGADFFEFYVGLGRKNPARFHIKVLKTLLKRCELGTIDGEKICDVNEDLSYFAFGVDYKEWDENIIKGLVTKILSFFGNELRKNWSGIYLCRNYPSKYNEDSRELCRGDSYSEDSRELCRGDSYDYDYDYPSEPDYMTPEDLYDMARSYAKEHDSYWIY